VVCSGTPFDRDPGNIILSTTTDSVEAKNAVMQHPFPQSATRWLFPNVRGLETAWQWSCALTIRCGTVASQTICVDDGMTASSSLLVGPYLIFYSYCI